MTENESVFGNLFAVNVNEHIEKKNGLSYVSWAWAWAEVKKKYPEAYYIIYENDDGWNYFTDGKTCWVKTGVVIDDLEHIEYLPVMDFRNNSIPVDAVKSTDVNKAIQRSLTKACARHGLGLYIYAGEDLPEEEKAKNAHCLNPSQNELGVPMCQDCGNAIKDVDEGGKTITSARIVTGTMKKYGVALCAECAKKRG